MQWPMAVLANALLDAGMAPETARTLLAMTWPLTEGDDGYAGLIGGDGALRWVGAFAVDLYAIPETDPYTLAALGTNAYYANLATQRTGNLSWHPMWGFPGRWSEYSGAAAAAVADPQPGIDADTLTILGADDQWPYDPSIIDQSTYLLWNTNQALITKWRHR